ncbi:carbohydrate kinase (plasmid) [Pseudorhodobacter turbinis]|uniref:Carbohydrate kinase n=1 Tax=Pseudorhodobacter turbinis TaxID=2500533 RepID=A0A4P8EJY0_9RHOB|nr:PfkB family carbohydrate kinase [Pseudorhodobacter turbinis]QCO57025.1 carbohydrate kinase [Pseudorhodobacter turbinis]
MSANVTSWGKRVLCTGRLYCDLVMSGLSAAPEPGQEVYASGLVLAAGGGAYITAAYLAALGRGAGLAAVLPAEPFAGAIATELSGAGLDLGACSLAAPGMEPQITVAMILDGDRAFVTRRAGLAFPEALGAAVDSGAWDHLHIGELASLVESPQVIARAKAAGMTISLDCSWDAKVLARDDLAQVMQGVDIFFPNRAEADMLAYHGRLAPLVVVKEGAAGARAISAKGSIHRPAVVTEVVDTVGAGDAFNAGFLDRWLFGAGLADCLDAGAHTASAAVARQGGARGLGRLTRHKPTAR